MRLKTIVNLILTAVVFIFAVVGCSCFSAISFAQNPGLPFIEVIELPEPFNRFLSYKAVLQAPVGTVIETERTGTYTMTESEYNFALSHYMYRGSTELRPPGEIVAGIDTTYVSKLGSTKIIFNPIPGSGTYSGQDPIEDYADFPSPGTYQLREGDQFVLAKMDSTIFSVTILELPDSLSE